jgi:lipopolysaccharide transport system ATP-binding protein
MRNDMHNPSAISLSGVSKVYKLYPSRVALAFDTLGLYRLRPGGAPAFPEHRALQDIDLEIARGERVGIIGRNGAGKTTLLRLVSGIAAPSAGSVKVGGRIQALFDTGLGFHPEFTGMEGIKASLLFNGLDDAQAQAAIADVAEFAELGDYLDQPLKTYSLGMRARLGFAAATAVRPDVLIIDEVLGAGDAYFQSKCAARIRGLTQGGTTMLLVSHSTQQVVQFCERAIWLENGQIARSGDTVEVVKAYEAHVREMENRQRARQPAAREAAAADPQHADSQHTSGRRISRWRGAPGLRLDSLRLLDRGGAESYVIASGDEAVLEATFSAETAGPHPWIAAFNVYTTNGVPVLAEHSEPRSLDAAAGAQCSAKLRLRPCLLGNGEYVVSVGIYRTLDLDRLDHAEYYDLWDRSLEFRVHTPHAADQSLFKPPVSWDLG